MANVIKIKRGAVVPTTNAQLAPGEIGFNTTDDSLYMNKGTDTTPNIVRVGEDANSILTKIKTVDGVGSGLDADLLDGKHASGFAGRGQMLYNGPRLTIPPGDTMNAAGVPLGGSYVGSILAVSLGGNASDRRDDRIIWIWPTTNIGYKREFFSTSSTATRIGYFLSGNNLMVFRDMSGSACYVGAVWNMTDIFG